MQIPRSARDDIDTRRGADAIGRRSVVPLGASYVLVIAPTTVTIQTQNGPAQMAGAVTLVCERGQDGWKILNEHYSTKMQ